MQQLRGNKARERNAELEQAAKAQAAKEAEEAAAAEIEVLVSAMVSRAIEKAAEENARNTSKPSWLSKTMKNVFGEKKPSAAALVAAPGPTASVTTPNPATEEKPAEEPLENGEKALVEIEV